MLEFSVEICVLPSPKSGSGCCHAAPALPGVKLFGRSGHGLSVFSGAVIPAPAQDVPLCSVFLREV